MTAKKATVSTKKAAETVKANDPVKTAESVKAETVKKEVVPVKKGEVVKKETASVKAEEPVKKEAAPAVKKETVKKTPAKKETAKKMPAKKAEAVQKIYVQYGGKEILTSDLVEKATQIWVEMGHRASSIKSLELYVKPEDMAAYYVINGKDTGKIEL